MYKFLKKYQMLILCGVLMLPLPAALIAAMLSNLLTVAGITISGHEIFSFYGTTFSIVFALIGVIATIELALKDKTDKENADTIPILVLDPISAPEEPSFRLLVKNNSMELVKEATGVRTDSFLLSNYGQQTAIHVTMQLKNQHLFLGTIKPMESKSLVFQFSDEIQEFTLFNLLFRCKTVRGELVQYDGSISVHLEDSRISSVGFMLFPKIRPIVLESSMSMESRGWISKKPKDVILSRKKESTRQEIFK